MNFRRGKVKFLLGKESDVLIHDYDLYLTIVIFKKKNRQIRGKYNLRKNTRIT